MPHDPRECDDGDPDPDLVGDFLDCDLTERDLDKELADDERDLDDCD